MRALAVDMKGPIQPAVKWLTENIGHSECREVKVVLKSDQDECTVVPKKAVAIRRPAFTASSNSPMSDSKYNGSAEGTVWT